MPWWMPAVKNYRREGWSTEEKTFVRLTNVVFLFVFLALFATAYGFGIRYFGRQTVESLSGFLALAMIYFASASASGLVRQLFAPGLFKKADANAKARLAKG